MMPPAIHTRCKGFTLIELLMVVLVLGFIVGGVLLGQSLIKSSELNKIIMEKNSLVTSIYNFKQRFKKIPGDMMNATTLWGAADADPTLCRTALGTGGTQTCNGNGDGNIGNWGIDDMYYESFRFWQHLKNAGLYQAEMTGVGEGIFYSEGVPGRNVPASNAIDGAGFGVYTRGIVGSTDSSMFEGDYRHIIVFGKQQSQNHPTRPVFTPEQAMQFDTKADDGNPAKGDIRTWSGFIPTCTTTNSSATAKYDLSKREILCSVIFVDAF